MTENFFEGGATMVNKIRRSMATPKKIVKAWRPGRVQNKMFERAREGIVVAQELTAIAVPLSLDRLPGFTGKVILEYEDGTRARCSLKEGILHGGYVRCKKHPQAKSDPLKRGEIIESGAYKNGYRVNLWQGLALGLKNNAILVKHKDLPEGKKGHQEGDFFMVYGLIPQIPLELQELVWPIHVYKDGNDVLEGPQYSLTKHLVRKQDAEDDKDDEDDEKKIPQKALVGRCSPKHEAAPNVPDDTKEVFPNGNAENTPANRKYTSSQRIQPKKNNSCTFIKRPSMTR